MTQADGDDTTFRLLADEWAFTLKLTRASEPYAMKVVEQFLQKGERDHDGRIRYKIWTYEALPGGLEPSPYDGAFWWSDPERGIRCDIKSWDSSACRTGPASAWWKEFDGRQTSDYRTVGIRFNHDIYVEFLWSIGLLPTKHASVSIGGVAATGQAGTVSTEGALVIPVTPDAMPSTTPAESPAIVSKRAGRPSGDRPQVDLACDILSKIYPPGGIPPSRTLKKNIKPEVDAHVKQVNATIEDASQHLKAPSRGTIATAIKRLKKAAATKRRSPKARTSPKTASK
jgi:hypothetical protein